MTEPRWGTTGADGCQPAGPPGRTAHDPHTRAGRTPGGDPAALAEVLVGSGLCSHDRAGEVAALVASCRASRRAAEAVAGACGARLAGGPWPHGGFRAAAPAVPAALALWCGAVGGGGAPPVAAGTVCEPSVRRAVRLSRIAVGWIHDAFGLGEPDGDWAHRALARHREDWDAGRIDEWTWGRRVAEDLIDAYLVSGDPRRESGKGGDEGEWRWSRELILDAVTGRRVRLLDVGCANGHLMVSLVRWGADRGLDVDPWGIDISPRIVRVARRRLGPLAGRVRVADARTWAPPHRWFDVVVVGLDCAPPGREADLVAHLCSRVCAPGGRLVLRPDRASPGRPSPVEILASLGFAADGELTSVHPTTGALRRTAWIAAR